MRNIVVYRGPSLLTGDPIIVCITGLVTKSLNPKTGPMLQVFVLREDKSPMDAVRDGSDDAICGDCALRGGGGHSRPCFVIPWNAPRQVYEAYHRGKYDLLDHADARTAVAGLGLRIAYYGDPAAAPFDVWQNILTTAGHWVAYTHQWRRCDPRLRWLMMASVESAADARTAQAQGWRTFRVRDGGDRDPILTDRSKNNCSEATKNVPIEVVCPASDEAGHRTTCTNCQLCRGRSRMARNVAIIVHGTAGAGSAFRRLHLVSHA